MILLKVRKQARKDRYTIIPITSLCHKREKVDTPLSQLESMRFFLIARGQLTLLPMVQSGRNCYLWSNLAEIVTYGPIWQTLLPMVQSGRHCYLWSNLADIVTYGPIWQTLLPMVQSGRNSHMQTDTYGLIWQIFTHANRYLWSNLADIHTCKQILRISLVSCKFKQDRINTEQPR